jgi:CubicO group peptidase (beta-lactamase class C family)
MALFLLLGQVAAAQPKKKNLKEIGTENYPSFDALMQKNAKGWDNEVVAMIWTDTLVYKRELGQFDSKTVVPLGAASQWLTTALVLRLADQGKISLDDKVADYLPIYETYGKSYITLRHCLTHYTGIRPDGKKKFGSLEEEVDAHAKKEIETNPGTEFYYSNVGPSIAGRVLEVVMKKKFDMLIKQQLFNPLGMRKSSFSNLDGSAVNPATGGQSSGDEYLRFLKMLLNGGKFNGMQFLSESSVQELRRISTTPALTKFTPKTSEGMLYAMGAWVIENRTDTVATALSGTGLTGAWPVVDWCRNYAALILLKSPQNEQKKQLYVEAKAALDEFFKSSCD